MKQAFQALVTAFIGTPAERAIHADLARPQYADYRDVPDALPPVALGPIATAINALNRQRDKLVFEAEELEHQIRIDIERARQLRVTSEAVLGALDKLGADTPVSSNALEVAHAKGQ